MRRHIGGVQPRGLPFIPSRYSTGRFCHSNVTTSMCETISDMEMEEAFLVCDEDGLVRERGSRNQSGSMAAALQGACGAQHGRVQARVGALDVSFPTSSFGAAELWSAGAMLPLSEAEPCSAYEKEPSFRERGSRDQSGSMAAALQGACGARTSMPLKLSVVSLAGLKR